ncbi:MAG: hypothetical protein JWM44_1179 [Bacilli bacterium]|nr:hypothetical protein [Bacilli bacterium]
MTKQEKLILLNSMPVIEYEADGESLYYAHVDNTLENQEKIKAAGGTENQIGEFLCDNGAVIDITTLALTIFEAKWYAPGLGGFIDYIPETYE